MLLLFSEAKFFPLISSHGVISWIFSILFKDMAAGWTPANMGLDSKLSI